ncbi:lipase-like PAD4 [Vigna radiata var. radiata]|uniref:Lipase-like PAD4 n=1 Tax=Vigna radiata var. radiata TaxID=3916 RepID=A0A1S3U860_VIGRR|nr:lipase-like PAD4 [Vigna radiata var. radiata]
MVADEASSFETSEMLATFLASTPLLSESWRLCTTTATSPPRSFLTEQGAGGMVYIAFPGIEMVAADSSWRTLVPLVSIGDVTLFSARRDKEDDDPVMVHAGVLNLLSTFFDAFQNQMLALMGNSNTKTIVITGHSIGGATASLCAVWLLSYLQHISSSSSSVSVLCITFGSPMLGNTSFSHAILKQRWGGNFCHVVSNHDIMPRLLFSPITPYTAQLNLLLQFWRLSTAAPAFGKLALPVSDQHQELFNVVMSSLDAATQDGEGSSILFHPFGSYLFVSSEGAVCVDSSTAVIKMMHLMFISASPYCSIEDHLKYGDYVKKLSLQFLNHKNSMQGNIPDSSYEAGLELAVHSSGLANQESAKECLKLTRRMGPSPTMNAAMLPIKLSKIVPYRTEIQWYKSWCDQQVDQMGYYDLFKRRRNTSKKMAMKVNMNRHKLARFWNDVIEMWERNELPHDLAVREKWVNASHFYKLLVEPLDIAEYYGKGTHTTKGHYLQHGRERRYEVFDRWWKDGIAAAAEENNERRSTFASLTQDSCFWARVEEARDWLNSVRSESDTSKLAVLWDNIEKFEKYAVELINNKEVSEDVLAKNSSYSTWVEDLKGLRELRAKVKRFPHNFSPFLDGEVIP